MSATEIDEAKLEAFMGQAVTDMGAIISAPLMVIGEKLGLYKAMAHAGPLTSQEVAERSGAAERYVREWLGNQAAGGYVTYDPETERYTLPDEHALALADEDSPLYILGVEDRITFAVATAKDYPGTGYDLVCVFDCLHDMGDPVGASEHILSTLDADGTWMIVEPFANDRVEENLNPVGRVFYGASTVICTPASLAQEVGLALGAQAGQARLTEVLGEGGFTRVRRATETPFNLVLEARP